MKFATILTTLLSFAVCAKIKSKPIAKLSDQGAKKLAEWKPTDKINPWEISGQYQGDIIQHLTSRNGVADVDLIWPNKIVPYDFDSNVSAVDKKFITKTLDYFNKETCVKFRPKESKDVDYILVTQDNTGCWSYVGHIGGPQVLNLQQNFCVWYGTVLHEFLHALGFFHQHSVPERDVYITVNWKNVEQGQEHNFDKQLLGSTLNYGEIYDFGSIMHYTENIFSGNGLPTISANVKGITLGRNISLGLSSTDLKKLKKMYNC